MAPLLNFPWVSDHGPHFPKIFIAEGYTMYLHYLNSRTVHNNILFTAQIRRNRNPRKASVYILSFEQFVILYTLQSLF